ncbi:MAG: hypothetical protein AAF432_11040 [Planctomycetota bacterium]
MTLAALTVAGILGVIGTTVLFALACGCMHYAARLLEVDPPGVRCPTCRYALRGLPDDAALCPECGMTLAFQRGHRIKRDATTELTSVALTFASFFLFVGSAVSAIVFVTSIL